MIGFGGGVDVSNGGSGEESVIPHFKISLEN
jgi:hypothetical protein